MIDMLEQLYVSIPSLVSLVHNSLCNLFLHVSLNCAPSSTFHKLIHTQLSSYMHTCDEHLILNKRSFTSTFYIGHDKKGGVYCIHSGDYIFIFTRYSFATPYVTDSPNYKGIRKEKKAHMFRKIDARMYLQDD